jgi:hypothetical protein
VEVILTIQLQQLEKLSRIRIMKKFFLVGFIYLGLFYDELAKGNEDYARILFRKAEGNIVQFYGGLEMLRVYYDLLEEDIFPSNREEFVSSSLRILKKCSFEHILYSRSLKLDII